MYKFLFFIQVLYVVFSAPLHSATMHVLTAGDPRGALKPSVKNDIGRMRTATRSIASEVGMKRHFKNIDTDRLSPNAILKWIKKAHVKRKDVFMFYFSGHGMQSRTGSKWPLIYCSKTRQSLDLAVVIQAIKKKRPRLCLILCDSCNNRLNLARFKSTHPDSVFGSNWVETRGLKRLFMKKKGSIIVCAAKPGTAAWGGANGGMMTISFLSALKEEAKRQSPAWKHLVSHVKKTSGRIQQPLMQLRRR